MMLICFQGQVNTDVMRKPRVLGTNRKYLDCYPKFSMPNFAKKQAPEKQPLREGEGF